MTARINCIFFSHLENDGTLYPVSCILYYKRLTHYEKL